MSNYSQISVIDGNTVHYYDTLTSEVESLLLIHGWLGSAVNFKRLCDTLHSEFRIVVPDLPGFGRSERPEKAVTLAGYVDFIDRFARECGLKSFTILGSSMGALVATHFTAKHPGKVNRVILINPYGLRRDGKLIRFFARSPSLGATTMSLINDRFVANIVRYRLFHDHDLAPAEVIEAFTGLFHTKTGRQSVLETTCCLIGEETMDDVLPSISQKTLIIASRRDGSKEERWMDVYREHLTDVHFIFIDKCGHMPSAEKPKETAAAVRSFLHNP